MTDYGYAGKILRVNLSTRRITTLNTADYAGRFLGGRGIAAKIYWDETAAETMALIPENCLIFITGPLVGFTRFSGCRWQICGKSPQMEAEAFSFANLGGSWGAWLKYAGYDGVVFTGQADGPVYLLIDNGKPELRDASHLWGKTTFETEDSLQAELGKDARICMIGPAAEKQVRFATILASDNSSGSSGLGSVMGFKRLKAVAVKVDKKLLPLAADPAQLKSLADQVYRLRTKNFEDYDHVLPGTTKPRACYGCIMGCTRGVYVAENGRQFKYFCQSAGVYCMAATKYYGETQGLEVSRLALRLYDKYGLDTAVMSPLLTWLTRCYEAGILNDENTGIPFSQLGSIEFIETLVRKIAYREGFGDALSQGVFGAARYIGKGSEKFISASFATRSGENRDYDARILLTNAMLYATEPRRPIQLLHHTALPFKRWTNWYNGRKDAFLSTELFRKLADEHWGSSEAGDLSTYAGKALAAKRIQDYGYIRESLILCDLAWPIYQVQDTDEYVGFGAMESRIISAITGRDINVAELIKTGERIFNLQRAILMRQGWGGRTGDTLLEYLHHEPLEFVSFNRECIIPGKDGQVESRKGAIIPKSDFEKLKDEYYVLRGWDIENGFQTAAKMAELGLNDIALDLKNRNLLK